MRYLSQFFIFVIVCVITTGCVAITAQVPRATFTFDYTPLEEATPNSADVTFAVLDRQLGALIQEGVKQLDSEQIIFWAGSPVLGYQKRATTFSAKAPVPLFENFANTMTKDFMEVLNAHGYSVKGPFETYNDMMYPDKEGSDLLLTADIQFGLDDSGVRWVAVKNMTWDPGEPTHYFAPRGSMTIKCHVDLVISESLTNENMWKKSIVITSFTVVIPKTPKFGEKLNSEILFVFLMKRFNEFHSQVGSALVEQYDNIGSKIYTYLDPREMAIIKNQAMELRKRKVY